MELLRVVNLFGVSVFAISGALKAREKKLDPVGFITLGVVTATGGGVLRDLILGISPPFVFRDELILAVAIAMSLLVFFVKIPTKGLPYFDALGLGFYSALSAHLAAAHGLPPLACLLVAMTASVGGGVLREVLVNDIPFIFRGTLYATASALGAAVYLSLRRAGTPESIALSTAAALTAGLRILAIRYDWRLPAAG